MGFRISWIATEASEEHVLSALQAKTTGRTDAYPDFNLCLVRAKPGITTVWSNDEEFFSDDRCAELAKSFPLIASTVNETVMYSDARQYANGQRIWKLWHEGDEDRSHLDSLGDLPASAKLIEQEKRREQAADDAEHPNSDDQCDIIFEIPLVLAESFSGFKHDEYDGEDDSCVEIESALLVRRKSFLSRLFGN